jgi:hypothetical protein
MMGMLRETVHGRFQLASKRFQFFFLQMCDENGRCALYLSVSMDLSVSYL